MGKQLLVQLDLAVLREHLSREDRRAVSEAEVRRWLQDAGFTPRGDRWVVNERDLGQVEPSEVISVEDVEEQ
jgi:hypothetical protein